jgi:hypothetical protein
MQMGTRMGWIANYFAIPIDIDDASGEGWSV